VTNTAPTDNGLAVYCIPPNLLTNSQVLVPTNSYSFFAADAVVLPYRVTAGSAVMFNALGHGLPFVATDLPSFKEFAAQGLGLTVKRNPHDFSKGLEDLDRGYSKYTKAVDAFKQKLKWDYIARQHVSIYASLAHKPSIRTQIKE
jgi:glycosyltransferase involved in cell wall biosynthesis